MVERQGILGNLAALLPRVSVPNSLALAFITGLATATDPKAAETQEIMKKVIGGNTHECIAIVDTYPKNTDTPGVYIVRGGSMYDSKGRKGPVKPPMLVVVPDLRVKKDERPSSVPLTENDMKKVFEIDKMLCKLEPVEDKQDVPPPKPDEPSDEPTSDLPTLPGGPDSQEPQSPSKRIEPRNKEGLPSLELPPLRSPGDIDLPPRPKDLPIFRPKR